MKRIKPIEKLKARAIRVALQVFTAEPSMGKRQAKALFTEILTHLKSGMEDNQAVQAIVKNHTADIVRGTPSNQLSLM